MDVVKSLLWWIAKQLVNPGDCVQQKDLEPHLELAPNILDLNHTEDPVVSDAGFVHEKDGAPPHAFIPLAYHTVYMCSKCFSLPQQCNRIINMLMLVA